MFLRRDKLCREMAVRAAIKRMRKEDNKNYFRRTLRFPLSLNKRTDLKRR